MVYARYHEAAGNSVWSRDLRSYDFLVLAFPWLQLRTGILPALILGSNCIVEKASEPTIVRFFIILRPATCKLYINNKVQTYLISRNAITQHIEVSTENNTICWYLSLLLQQTS